MSQNNTFMCSAWHQPPATVHPNPYEVASALTYTTIRHPFDRMVSEYEMRSRSSPDLNSTHALNRFVRKYLKTVLAVQNGHMPLAKGAVMDCHFIPQHAYVRGRRYCSRSYYC